MPVCSIPITLDKERHIRYTYNALCTLEGVLGLTIENIGQALSGSVSVTTIRAVLYAGLSDEDPTLSQRKVGDLLTDHIANLAEIAEKIRQAWEGTWAKVDEEVEKKAEGTIPSPGIGEKYLNNSYDLALGRIGLRPHEFWRLTPADFYHISFGHHKAETEREKSAWKRDAFFTAALMNSTGNYKRKIKPEDLVRFTDDDKPVKPLDPEEQRAQALAQAKFHKAKFWGLINGRTLDDVKIPDDFGKPVERDVRAEAVKAIITGGK